MATFRLMFQDFDEEGNYIDGERDIECHRVVNKSRMVEFLDEYGEIVFLTRTGNVNSVERIAEDEDD